MTEPTTQHTPAAQWREHGEPDPHAGHYDCERHELSMGKLTDDELANAVYLHGDSAYHAPTIQQLIDGTGHTSGSYLQAAKDRIRWLSRKLVKAEQQHADLMKAFTRYGKHDSDCPIKHGMKKCNCGLDAAIAKARGNVCG